MSEPTEEEQAAIEKIRALKEFLKKHRGKPGLREADDGKGVILTPAPEEESE